MNAGPGRYPPSLPARILTALDRRIPDPGGVLVAYVALSTMAGLVAVTALLVGAAWALAGPIQSIDDAVLHWVAARQTEGWVEFALDVTALGNTLTLAVLLACVSAGFWLDGRRLEVALLVIGGATGRLATELWKALLDRPRPDVVEWGTHVVSAALPSAHAMSATMVYGAIAYLVGRRAGPRLRRTVWTVAAVVIVAVAASRVYLGVHYPTDVIAGVVAGALWMTFVLSAIPACASRRSATNIRTWG